MTCLSGSRWSVFSKESSKCVLLCHNCHTEVHVFGTVRNTKLKKHLLALKNAMCCERCGYNKNVGSLIFHHKDPSKKDFCLTVCRIRYPDITAQKIVDELNKCSVLCGNCHRLEHTNLDRFENFKSMIYEKIKTHKELPPAYDKNTILKMYQNGKTQTDIVKAMGCSKSTISTILHGLTTIPKRHITIHKKTCAWCKKEFKTSRQIVVHCCRSCARFAQGAVQNKPSFEELAKMKETMSYAELAKKYGVSRPAVFRWLHPKAI